MADLPDEALFAQVPIPVQLSLLRNELVLFVPTNQRTDEIPKIKISQARIDLAAASKSLLDHEILKATQLHASVHHLLDLLGRIHKQLFLDDVRGIRIFWKFMLVVHINNESVTDEHRRFADIDIHSFVRTLQEFQDKHVISVSSRIWSLLLFVTTILTIRKLVSN